MYNKYTLSLIFMFLHEYLANLCPYNWQTDNLQSSRNFVSNSFLFLSLSTALRLTLFLKSDARSSKVDPSLQVESSRPWCPPPGWSLIRLRNIPHLVTVLVTPPRADMACTYPHWQRIIIVHLTSRTARWTWNGVHRTRFPADSVCCRRCKTPQRRRRTTERAITFSEKTNCGEKCEIYC